MVIIDKDQEVKDSKIKLEKELLMNMELNWRQENWFILSFDW